MYDSEFLDDSIVDILVPQDSDYDVAEIISSTINLDTGESDGSRLFSFIPQRNILYFDELISICVVLRTPYSEEPELQSFISRLDIVVEAHAVGSSRPSDVSQDQSSSQNRDIIWSAAVDTTEEPLIIIQEKDVQTAKPSVFVTWKLTAFLNRPRIRLQSPKLVFTPIAVLRAASATIVHLDDDRFLAGGVPASLNLLDPLKDDPLLHGPRPRLSALGLSRIGSTNQEIISRDQKLKALPQPAFRSVPALTARVRYSKSSAHIRKPTVFASLDIEAAPFSNNDIVITAAKMSLSDGSATYLSPNGLNFPIPCRPKDNPVFLFHLIPSDGPHDSPTTNRTSKTLDISIEANVVVSETCRPRIEMRWKTGVDFSIALNPSYGASGQSLQRKQRPASLPVTPVTGNKIETPPTANEADSAGTVPTPERQLTTSVSDLGVTVTLTAPSDVRVGEPFCWDVFVVNRSNKSRRLAITVIPKRKRGEFKGHLSRPSSSSMGGRKETRIADHVLDENLLYAMQRNVGKEPPQIVTLSTDVKIGPLNPGSCYNADLRFLPLTKGVLQLEAIRVVDVVSNESVDIRDLPDIVAAE
ncbi:hypothetical protein MMC07_003998 [Pseudocyphellaria aurata]|nr:hypothetical protein [Pseudocyphellaria aurata]